MDESLRIPDAEIFIGGAGFELARVGFYQRGDVHQGYDVVIVIADKNSVSVIRQILQDCITTLAQGHYFNGAGGGEIGDYDGGESPF